MVLRLLKLPNNNSFFLFGARSTGKTSLLKEFFRSQPDTLMIDLLNEDLYEKYLLSPQLLKNEIDLLKKKPTWIILDEVQRVPQLLNIVHQLIESKDSIRFALTGSSARRLKQKGVNLLAGRAWIRNLYPLTFLELQNQFNLEEIINYGSLPKILSFTTADDKVDFLKSYASTYIKTEIQEEQWVRKLEPFRRFLAIAAQMNGKPINYTSISRDVGVETPTVKTYYEILEDTLLGFLVPSFGPSVRKQQRIAPKFYFFDLGVKKALGKTLSVRLNPQTSEWGYAFEHLVIAEIQRLNDNLSADYELSYLLTKDGFEIDLILTRAGSELIFIEIKSAEKVHIEDFSKLAHFITEQKGIGYVLSNDPTARIDQGLLLLPWRDGLKKIFGLE